MYVKYSKYKEEAETRKQAHFPELSTEQISCLLLIIIIKMCDSQAVSLSDCFDKNILIFLHIFILHGDIFSSAFLEEGVNEAWMHFNVILWSLGQLPCWGHDSRALEKCY